MQLELWTFVLQIGTNPVFPTMVTPWSTEANLADKTEPTTSYGAVIFVWS